MKHGFTLAEVLVTLGIIGVVAALTTPALIQNVGNAKVGPKLAKAKSTFENAMTTLLVDNSSNTIRGVVSELPNGDDDKTASKALGKELGKYMKISPIDIYTVTGYNGSTHYNNGYYQQMQTFASDDGMVYWLWLWGHTSHPGKGDWEKNPYPDIPSHQLIGAVYVDINGNQSPNVIAKDIFLFYLFNDGSLRPAGGQYFKVVPNYDKIWNATGEDTSKPNCSKTIVMYNGEPCTGSIFDNGMKIIYQ